MNSSDHRRRKGVKRKPAATKRKKHITPDYMTIARKTISSSAHQNSSEEQRKKKEGPEEKKRGDSKLTHLLWQPRLAPRTCQTTIRPQATKKEKIGTTRQKEERKTAPQLQNPNNFSISPQ